ncbi:MAG: helix-turn-helix transcriptional regulator [Pseudomonadota bacterium]
MTITTAQMRAARGLLNWTQGDLAARTGISTTSIGSIESDHTNPRDTTIHLIQKAFEDAGIAFLPDDGVRRHQGHVRILNGRTGFHTFYDDIFAEAQKSKGATFLVNNVDEKLFLKWGSEIVDQHTQRMQDLAIRYNILVREGDMNFVETEYATYRWLPKEMFSAVSFYVYGQKMAIIVFDQEPSVVIMDYPAITEAYRRQFTSLWDTANNPMLAGKVL